MAETTHAGGCLCGAVRYAVRGEPLLVEYCHCAMCRRAAGAPVVVWMDVPAAAFAVSAGQPAWYGSSPDYERGFCAACGSPLFFRARSGAAFVSVAVATLDDPGGMAPVQHIFDVERLPWLRLDDDLPRYRARSGDG